MRHYALNFSIDYLLKNEALCDFPMKKIPGTCRSGTGTAPCGTSRFCNSWIDEPWRASARRFKTSEGLGQNSRARGLKRPPPKRYAKRGGGCLPSAAPCPPSFGILFQARAAGPFESVGPG